jgi:hypothetical protein
MKDSVMPVQSVHRTQLILLTLFTPRFLASVLISVLAASIARVGTRSSSLLGVQARRNRDYHGVFPPSRTPPMEAGGILTHQR